MEHKQHPNLQMDMDGISCLSAAYSEIRADSRFAPSQWKTALLCNNISQWLGTNLESALEIVIAVFCTYLPSPGDHWLLMNWESSLLFLLCPMLIRWNILCCKPVAHVLYSTLYQWDHCLWDEYAMDVKVPSRCLSCMLIVFLMCQGKCWSVMAPEECFIIKTIFLVYELQLWNRMVVSQIFTIKISVSVRTHNYFWDIEMVLHVIKFSTC